jgi:hypothetical protein
LGYWLKVNAFSARDGFLKKLFLTLSEPIYDMYSFLPGAAGESTRG